MTSPGAPVSAAEASAASHLSCGQQVSFPAPNSGKVCAHSVMNGDGGLLAILITAAEAELDPLAISTSMLAANLLGIHLSVSERLEGVLAGLRTPLMATTLNVHRHTVRRRLQRVEEILGVGLEEARLRRELWFACQVIERNAQASLPSTAGGSAA